jgi:hypothetical protein
VRRLLDVGDEADVVVLGDLNDFRFSPSITTLRTGTADGSGRSVLTDLISALPAAHTPTRSRRPKAWRAPRAAAAAIASMIAAAVASSGSAGTSATW